MDMPHFCQPCDHQNYLLFCSLQWRELRVPAHLGPTGLRDTPSKAGMLSILITCILGKHLLHSVSQLEFEVCLLHLLHLYFHLSFDLDHTDIGEMTKKGVRLYLQEGPVKIITVKEYTMLYYPHSQAIPMFILATLLVFEIACSACVTTPLITEHIKAVSEGCGSQGLQVHSTCQSPATYMQSKQLLPHTPTP